MKKNALIFICLLAVCLVIGCTSKKTKTNRQLFEERFEVNVKACMLPMMHAGVDSLVARKACECVLNLSFDLDSTFVNMTPDAFKEFVNKHQAVFEEQCYPPMEDLDINEE